MRGDRTPVPSLARSDSTTELSPQGAGADSGDRTRIDGVEARGPAFGRCPRGSCSRGLHSPSPAYQAGAPLSGPEQHGGTGRDRTGYLLTASQALSRVSYGPRIEAGGPAPSRAARGGPHRLGGESADEQRTRVGWFGFQSITHALRLVRVERRGLEPRSLPCGGRILPVEISPRSMRAAAPPRRIELPSPDRQSGCFTRCIRGQKKTQALWPAGTT